MTLACTFFGWTIDYTRAVPLVLLLPMISSKLEFQAKSMGGTSERDPSELATMTRMIGV